MSQPIPELAPVVVEPTRTPAEAIVDLGFDPDAVRAIVVTPTSAIAIAVDYPEPYVAPKEAP